MKNRTSEDHEINENGKELLQLCRTNKLYILNGRVGPEPEGGFTCHTSRGNSVVDYIITSDNILSLTETFCIGEPSPLSDHSSVTASFKYVSYIDVMNEKQEHNVMYRWKNRHNTSYINNLNSTHTAKKLNDLKGSVSRCVNHSNDMFIHQIERHYTHCC